MQKLPILGYEGMYEVDEQGNIYSIPREVLGKDGTIYTFIGKKKAYVVNKNGYLQVQLYKNNIQSTLYVHRLVAQTFIPNPQELDQVNHIDGDKLNCSKDNLEWASPQSNSQHAVDIGLREYPSRMTEADWLSAIQEVLAGSTLTDVCGRSPYKLSFFSTKIRKMATQHNLLHLLNDAILENRKKQARVNGNKNK